MRWGLTSNVCTLMIAAPAREIVSKVSCEPLYRPAEVQCPLWVGSRRTDAARYMTRLLVFLFYFLPSPVCVNTPVRRYELDGTHRVFA